MIAIKNLRYLTAVIALTLATALTTLPALAADSDGIAGVWWTPGHDGKIAIEIDDTGVIGGRLIAVAPEKANSVDANNPDTKLRFRPVLGLPILQGFAMNTEGVMAGGTIYEPDSGRTYYGTLSFDQEGKLAIRESLAFNLLWRTEVMQRVDGPAPATHQDGEPDLAYLAP